MAWLYGSSHRIGANAPHDPNAHPSAKTRRVIT
jgi:hypothetical protein